MSDDARVAVANEELFTVRDAMRSLNRIVDDINAGVIEKAVLTRHGKMVCVVVGLKNAKPRTTTQDDGGPWTDHVSTAGFHGTAWMP